MFEMFTNIDESPFRIDKGQNAGVIPVQRMVIESKNGYGK
jgi:hypothetical protein